MTEEQEVTSESYKMELCNNTHVTYIGPYTAVQYTLPIIH